MPAQPYDAPDATVSLALDASAGLDAPAPAKAELRIHISATDERQRYADLSPADRDVAFRKLWRKTYDFVTPQTVAMTDDPTSGDLLLTMTGTAKMEWTVESGTRWYELDRARLGWKFETAREGEINGDAPYAVSYPDWWASRETIVLPQSGRGFGLQGGAVDRSVGGIFAFHRAVAIDHGTLRMDTSTRALRAELPFAEAEAARSQMAELAQTGVFVRAPDDYQATAADLSALASDKPALATALVKRAGERIDARQLDAGLADADAAISAQPELARAHLMRAFALVAKDDPRAAAEVDRTLALDAKEGRACASEVVWRSRRAGMSTRSWPPRRRSRWMEQTLTRS